jgi:hypothetical protein
MQGQNIQLRLRELQAVAPQANVPPNFLPQYQPFNVRLVLDLGEAEIAEGTSFDYTAVVYTRRMDNGGSRQVVGAAQGPIYASGPLAINLAGKPLPAGLHRLEAVVTVVGLSPTGPNLAAHIEGSLLQVQ